MTTFAIEVRGTEDVQKTLRQLAGREMDRAASMALNKVAAKARTEADRAIRDRFAVASDQVRGSMVLIRAKHNGRNLEAIVQIFGSPTKRGRSMNLVRFLERSVTLAQAKKRRKAGTLKQLRFKILKSGGLKTIDGSFLGNNGRTVFRRTGEDRLPIEPVQVIGVSQMFNTRVIRSRVLNRVNRELLDEVNRAVALVISRR